MIAMNVSIPTLMHPCFVTKNNTFAPIIFYTWITATNSAKEFITTIRFSEPLNILILFGCNFRSLIAMLVDPSDSLNCTVKRLPLDFFVRKPHFHNCCSLNTLHFLFFFQHWSCSKKFCYYSPSSCWQEHQCQVFFLLFMCSRMGFQYMFFLCS
jgi:hypothetical protein